MQVLHSHLDHALRLAIKRMLGISIDDPGYWNETRGMAASLRERARELITQRYGRVLQRRCGALHNRETFLLVLQHVAQEQRIQAMELDFLWLENQRAVQTRSQWPRCCLLGIHPQGSAVTAGRRSINAGLCRVSANFTIFFIVISHEGGYGKGAKLYTPYIARAAKHCHMVPQCRPRRDLAPSCATSYPVRSTALLASLGFIVRTASYGTQERGSCEGPGPLYEERSTETKHGLSRRRTKY